jgi:hypothetical protein
MTRLSLYALFATLLAGPWSGCDRPPVAPPGVPPPERALDRATPSGSASPVLLDESRRRG